MENTNSNPQPNSVVEGLLKADKSKFQIKKYLYVFVVIVAIGIFLLISRFLFFKHSAIYSIPINQGANQFFTGLTTTSNMKLIPGERLDNRGCKGSGTVMFGTSPMNIQDIGIVLPLGGMTGSHVIPIDHMYFSPLNFRGPRDEYEVHAIADGVINEIEQRTQWIEDTNNGAPKPAEYQLRFWHTCDFSSYFDLLTSLSPRIQAEFDAHKNGNHASVQISIKEGEVVGKIGGQTLDFAVFDYTKILPGFIHPEYYLDEPWKVHVVDAFDFFKEPLRSQLLSLDPRGVEPRSGEIDYDIDGKLVGNWFKEGFGGFHTARDGNSYPWRNFLTFAYDYIYPSQIRISIGDFNGQSQQFGVVGNAPDPATIGINNGIVKYQLVQYSYLLSNGDTWTAQGKMSSVRNETQIQGVALAQLIEARKLKFEVFPGQTANQVSGFSNAAQIYER